MCKWLPFRNKTYLKFTTETDSDFRMRYECRVPTKYIHKCRIYMNFNDLKKWIYRSGASTSKMLYFLLRNKFYSMIICYDKIICEKKILIFLRGVTVIYCSFVRTCPRTISAMCTHFINKLFYSVSE